MTPSKPKRKLPAFDGVPSDESIALQKGYILPSDQDHTGTLEAFGEKVKAAQDAHDPDIEHEKTGWAVGVRYASEFSASVIVGGMLGWAVDHFANTVPWGMLIGIILGFIAGTRNIVRLAKEMSVDVDEG